MGKRGFTFYELLVVVVILAIITVGVMPDNRAKLAQETELAADKFESDVAYARSLAIADPADPAIIKMDMNNNRYWIAKSSDPATPITHPLTKQPYIVSFGSTGPSATTHVQLSANDFGTDQMIQFDGTGSIDQQSGATVQLSAGSAQCQVDILPTAADCTVAQKFTKNLSVGGAQAMGG